MEQRHVWISMDDGVRLAARLFLPGELPAPAIVDAIPYRMDDLTASYASEYERLCEEGGFAVCRLDLRGTGSSEGIALDEYNAQEQADICAVIAWLADQEWCTGRVGMYGTSWGGFNSIQVAMERPPALHAIVPIYASDDRYTDDVHYMGGILKAIDLVDWVIYMAACNVLPPVPAVYGDGWREEWLRRIEGTEPWLLRWLEEQDDGPYWRHGSLRPSYERITCPTMIVAGWADGYTNIALRAYEALTCPRRVIIGPWAHASTATSIPGPHIDLVPELIRWFSRWLRDEPNGIDREPPLAVFMRRSTRPAPDVAEMRGEWRSEPTWPAERLRPTVWRPDGDERDRIVVQGDVGTAAWISCAGKPPWTLPDDQREDDALSLTYDWPLEEELELLGHPRLRLTITSPHPVAFLSARLCDVFPDGASALVSRGVLNLTHRESHSEPKPLEAGCSDADRPRARGDVLDLRGRPSPAARARGLGLAEHLAASSRRRARGRAGHGRARAPRARRPTCRGTARLLSAATTDQARRAGHRAAADRAPDRARHRGPPDARRDELWVSLRRPLRREDRGGLRRPGGSLREEPRPCVGERANALLDRVAGGVRHDRSAPQLSLHVSSVPRRRRGRRLGRRT